MKGKSRLNIDLNKVIENRKDCIHSRASMKEVLLDLYPNETREMNVLLSIYESGIPKRIKKEQMISDTQFSRDIQKIFNDYGILPELIVDGLKVWIDACLGKGASQNVRYEVKNHFGNLGSPENLYIKKILMFNIRTYLSLILLKLCRVIQMNIKLQRMIIFIMPLKVTTDSRILNLSFQM